MAAATARKVDSKGPRRGRDQWMRAALRSLRRFALAAITVFVCAGMMSVGRGSVSLLATTFDLAQDSVDVDWRPAGPQPSRCQQGGSERLDLEAVESDLDEEDPFYDVPVGAALAFRELGAPGTAKRTWRRERDTDPSRFIAGAGLPRGPPV